MADPDIISLEAINAAIDNKTKPLGSLGKVEDIARQIALIQNTLRPEAKSCQLTIFAADHGMAMVGVSAFPQDVTRQMVTNFLSGGAAANIFADTLGIDVQVVDAGVAGTPIAHERLIDCRVGAGTQNAIEGPAMSAQEYTKALVSGKEIGKSATTDAVCFGEMGIGNTSSASLVSAKLMGRDISNLVGRGTGLDDTALERKQMLLKQAADRTPDKLTADRALQEYGGFEIVMMAGAMIGAAEAGHIVVVDGFIASSAALCARALVPDCEGNLIYGHKSAEAGHRLILDELNAKPLLDLDMRLGEGTGALLAWPIIRSAAAMLSDMASFESAGVDGPQ